MQTRTFLRMLYVTLTLILLSLTLASSVWAAEYKVLYKFQGGTDGASPYAGLIFDAAGTLYGTTLIGGDLACNGGHGCGTVFKLTPNPDESWMESVLYSFGGSDGAYPDASLIFDKDGNLYGTNYNAVFKLTPNLDGSWTESVLYSFTGGRDGDFPYAGLIFGTAGSLYGTTVRGGDYKDGTVFKLTPNPDGSWTESVLYSFTGGEDGDSPYGGLIFDTAGSLYGTTSYGGMGCGDNGCGTVFKLTPKPDGSWMKNTIHVFTGRDGYSPFADLIFDAAGNLYGTTASGPVNGTAFKLTPQPDGSWKWSKLHSFRNYTVGAGLYRALTFDPAGNLYGTTTFGGAHGYGTVFKLTPNPDGSWKRSTLHTFQGSDGAYPYADLIFDVAGNLYGTTSEGGKGAHGGYGVVFEITP